mgnify:CR=1 FL=1
MFNQKEIELWEQEQAEKENSRYCTAKNTRLFDPKKERLFKARKYCTLKWFWGKEHKYARKKIQDRFRMQMKTKLIRGDYHNPVPHEYKTYGWETW